MTRPRLHLLSDTKNFIIALLFSSLVGMATVLGLLLWKDSYCTTVVPQSASNDTVASTALGIPSYTPGTIEEILSCVDVADVGEKEERMQQTRNCLQKKTANSTAAWYGIPVDQWQQLSHQSQLEIAHLYNTGKVSLEWNRDLQRKLQTCLTNQATTTTPIPQSESDCQSASTSLDIELHGITYDYCNHGHKLSFRPMPSYKSRPFFLPTKHMKFHKNSFENFRFDRLLFDWQSFRQLGMLMGDQRESLNRVEFTNCSFYQDGFKDELVNVEFQDLKFVFTDCYDGNGFILYARERGATTNVTYTEE